MKYDYEVRYDVAVVGGGVAGVAAAVQAARRGMKTVLLEKTIFTGGLATSGLIFVYLPLCDGNGRQVSCGIVEELIQASMKYGPGEVADWKTAQNAPEAGRYRCIFSPASFILALDEFLQENGVDVWYDTLVCGAEVSRGAVRSVICENKSGRGRIRTKCVIDASGDCEVARRIGLPCLDENNYLSMWAIEYAEGRGAGPLGEHLSMRVQGVAWDPEKAPEGTVFRGVSGKTVTDFVQKSRKMLRDSYAEAYANGSADRTSLYPVKLPVMPQFRKIYCLDSAYVLDSDENNKRFEDSVGMASDWRKSGPVWEIPYRTLYPASRLGGLLAAGRCTGAKNDAWEITRVIPTAAVTGQAAGLAAALSIRKKVQPPDLDVSLLQKELRKEGVVLHLADVGLPDGTEA